MTLQEFFHMGGYGFYVWGSYLTALILIGGEVLAVRLRRQKLATREVAADRVRKEEHE